MSLYDHAMIPSFQTWLISKYNTHQNSHHAAVAAYLQMGLYQVSISSISLTYDTEEKKSKHSALRKISFIP